MLGVEAFDLFDRSACILGEVEDVDLPLTLNDSHADGSVTQGIDAVLLPRKRIGLEIGAFQKLLELTLDDFARRDPVPVFWKEQVVSRFGFVILIDDVFPRQETLRHRVGDAIPSFAVSDRHEKTGRIMRDRHVLMPDRVEL